MQLHPVFKELLNSACISQAPNTFHMDAASLRAARQAYLALLEEALRQQPEDPDHQNFYALTLGRLDRDEEALTYFQRMVEKDPDNTDHMNNIGMTLHKLGRSEEALVYAQRLIEIKPDQAVYQNNLCVVLRRLGRVEEALTHVQRAIELKADHPVFHLNLARTLNRLGRHDEALKVFETISTLNYDGDLQIHVLHEEGIALAATNQKQKGVFLLQHAFKLAAKAQNDKERNEVAATLTNLGVPVPEVA